MREKDREKDGVTEANESECWISDRIDRGER